MTKDNLVTIAMIVLLAVTLIFAARAVLTNNSSRDAKAAPNHVANSASAGPEQPASTPVASGQLEDDDTRIWTTEEMRNAQPYPMPILPGSGPTKVSSDNTLDGSPRGAEGGKPTKP